MKFSWILYVLLCWIVLSIIFWILLENFYLGFTWNEEYGYSTVAVKLVTSASNIVLNNWLKQMEQKYRGENQRIYDVCQKYKKESVTKIKDSHDNMEQNILTNWMVDVEHGLAYCRHGKVIFCSNYIHVHHAGPC